MKDKPTAEPHFKAYTEAGLHDLAHGLIGEMSSHWSEQQGPQNLQKAKFKCNAAPVPFTWTMRQGRGTQERSAWNPGITAMSERGRVSRSHFKVTVVLKGRKAEEQE